MSDQDFFFDEEDEARPTESSAPAGKAKTGSGAKPQGAASAPAKRGGAAPAASSDTSAQTPLLEQNVTVMVAGMLMVVGILVGFIIGFLIGGGTSAPAAVPSTTSAPVGAVTPGTLTDQQVQQGLPAGHPSIGATGTGATGAPSAATTP
ncbi:MAG TPA: hypothetical protein VF902_04490 [Coriobacteriia bacterium]